MRKIIKDILYNVISSFLIVLVIQFLIYPFLAKDLSIKEYGLFLLSIGVINMISIGFSSSIGNLRLINQKKYIKTSEYNNFLTLVFIVTIIIYIISRSLSEVINIYYLVLALCMIFKNYHSYSFRIEINYNNVLVLNLITASGYLLGLIFYKLLLQEWIFIFLIGEVLGTVFVILKAKTVKEEFKVVKNKKMYSQFFSLSMASLISNSMIYIDRLLLFPLLGSTSVSIFVVASFVGKSIGLVVTPINSVFLTYISKKNDLSLKLFQKICFSLTIVFCLIFIVTYFLGDYITKILYPAIYDDSKKYIGISSASALTFIFGTILNTFLLKMSDIKWQLRVQIVYVIIYIIFGGIFLIYYDLELFIYFTIILNLFRISLIYFIIKFTSQLNIEERT
ncbi:hypothetical protein HNY42_14820 [Exiguobacterium sp. Helios]|uniref:lipopolysaccharide biosynthesis protein n=1 Tax=Exiguobacterium sp. Helios TaxID=2735868 RepID=UPI00165D871B|nr:hypothetical protein [Exiguobacterium sp. Helios]QNR22164.1 hypothetical protein HNY42_14820 [Exiguobacterium sp. Helios]